MKIYAGYIRVSTQEQSRRGVSLEAQEEAIKTYCEQNGLRLHKIYVDRGVTARKELHLRKAFAEMMSDVDAGTVNHILVIRLDRFFRNIYDYHKMMREHLEPHGCDWSAIYEEYDTTTTNGRLMINLRLAIAEQECDQDSDRIKDVHAHLIAEGRLAHGNTPIGYSNINHRAVPNEDAEKVRFFFDRLIFTRSVSYAIEEVNNRFGTRFHYKKGRDILNNKMYIGVCRDNNHYCEPIIDRATWDEAQRIVKHRTKRSTYNTYLFSGMVFCAECGRAMAGTETKGYKYYRCPNTLNSSLCANKKRIRESYIEDYLRDTIEDNFAVEKARAESEIQKKKKTAGNEKQISDKIDRLTELFINGIITMDELKKRKADLEAQIVRPEPENKSVRIADVEKVLKGGFLSIYNNLTDMEKKYLWYSIINKIIVYDAIVKRVSFWA